MCCQLFPSPQNAAESLFFLFSGVIVVKTASFLRHQGAFIGRSHHVATQCCNIPKRPERRRTRDPQTLSIFLTKSFLRLKKHTLLFSKPPNCFGASSTTMNNSLIVNKSSSKYRLTPITPTCLTASIPIGRRLWSSSQSEAGARGPERLLGVACRATASEEILDLSREGRACCFHQLRGD